MSTPPPPHRLPIDVDSPPTDEFDLEGEVFEGRILPRVEVKALESTTQPATTESAEGEDQ